MRRREPQRKLPLEDNEDTLEKGSIRFHEGQLLKKERETSNSKKQAPDSENVE